jgi:Flp pilus assembly protein TadG
MIAAAIRHRLGRQRGLWADRRGATAVEFAVLLPVFLPLIFGVIQLGEMFWTQTAMQHAVEMAARCAAINATTCGSASQTQTYATTQAYGLTLPSGTFTASSAACGNQVAASYTFPFVTAWFPATINLTAQSCHP